ncbi:MAG: hypothetical protein ACOC95_07810 [Planctomycetota bacterium]
MRPHSCLVVVGLAFLVLLTIGRPALAQRIPIPEGFPTVATTGHSGPLTPSASITATTPGMVIETLDISGSVLVKANNVTIRNRRIVGGLYSVNAGFGYTGTLVEDCTVYSGDSKGIYGGNMTIRRCDISRYRDCMQVQSNVLVEDCYPHDVKVTADTGETDTDTVVITVAAATPGDVDLDDFAILKQNVGQ